MPTTSNLDTVELGACDITWNGNNLGVTIGGVDVKITYQTKEITVDQYGNTPINEYVMGATIEVTAPLAESDLEKLALTMPDAVLVADATKKKLSVKTGSGVNLREKAAQLIIHPRNKATDLNSDLVIPLATPIGNIEYKYSHEDVRVYPVTFKGYPNSTTGLLFFWGDNTVT